MLSKWGRSLLHNFKNLPEGDLVENMHFTSGWSFGRKRAMPRQSQLDTPGTLHHVMIRGIEGKSIFRDNQERKGFVARLGNLTKQTGTRILPGRCLATMSISSFFRDSSPGAIEPYSS